MQETAGFLTTLIGALPMSTLSAAFVAVLGLIYGAIKIYSSYKKSQETDRQDIDAIQKSTAETASNLLQQAQSLNKKLDAAEKTRQGK